MRSTPSSQPRRLRTALARRELDGPADPFDDRRPVRFTAI
jgi:hypothetical protein